MILRSPTGCLFTTSSERMQHIAQNPDLRARILDALPPPLPRQYTRTRGTTATATATTTTTATAAETAATTVAATVPKQEPSPHVGSDSECGAVP